MGLGQVHDVDIIAEAGPVRRRIVVAEDGQARALADGCLGDEGDEVVRDPARELADQGAGMRPDGVEIAQEDALDLAAGSLDRILEDVLTHLLGRSVRRGRRLPGGLLGHRELLGLAVHGRGGREEDVAAPLPFRRFQHIQETPQIVLVVEDGLFDGLADGLEGREMDDRIDLVFGEERLGRGRIAEIHLLEGNVVPSGDFLDPLEAGHVAVGQIVGDHDLIAGPDKFDGHMAPDEARSARYQYSFFHFVCS